MGVGVGGGGEVYGGGGEGLGVRVLNFDEVLVRLLYIFYWLKKEN